MVLAQYLLTFREVLEAALLTAIIMAFLVRTGREALKRYAWYGVYGATGSSLALGAGIWVAYGGLSDAGKVLFEGIAALIAVGVLTSMIYWMAVKGRTMKTEIEQRVQLALSQGAVLSIAAVTFVLVFREGLETVLFLTPFLVQDPGATLVGAALGIGAGVALSYVIFTLGMKLDLRRFFYFTSILLILLAGGLLGYGVHELREYGTKTGAYSLGWWGTEAFNLGLSDGDLLHHKGAVGSIFAVLFGYSQNPEWIRVATHAAYLAVALPLIVIIYKRPEWVATFVTRVRALLRRPSPTGEPHQQP